MRTLTCLLSTCLILFSWNTYAANDQTVENIIPALEKQIAQSMKANGIPGMAIAVVSRDKIHYLKTFGVKRIGSTDQITPNTLFQIASLSKPVHATLIAILQDQGKLHVDDPVSTHLPNFSIKSQQTLRICHLMSHSSGISSNGFNEMIESYTPRDQIVNRLQKVRPVSAPGKNFLYNNAMYGVVEDVLSSASGKSLDKVIQEELFTPLGMKTACLGLDALLKASDKAYPHVPNRRGKYVPADNYSKAYYAFRAAGGINASITDLVPFLQLYLGKSNNVVTTNTLSTLTNPFIKNKNAVIATETKQGTITETFYGLGWQSMRFSNEKVIYHQGHLKGFRNFIGFIEDDVGIVILTNAERRHASKIAIKFFDLYLQSKRAANSL